MSSQKSDGSASVLGVRDLVKTYPRYSTVLHRRIGDVRALKGVDLTVREGRTTALVGESGSGKSTLARCVVGLERPDSGVIQLDGQVLDRRSRFKEIAKQVQIVFQDPNSSLTPHMSVQQLVEEPLIVHGTLTGRGERSAAVNAALESVGLPRRLFSHRPHELSGGQRQRVAIARALVLRPRVLVLDEPVSALDVSVQAQILVLLRQLQVDFNTSFLLISHDLAVVRSISDYVYVMYRGNIVERGLPSVILNEPSNSYTAQLLRSEPSHPAWNLDALVRDEVSTADVSH